MIPHMNSYILRPQAELDYFDSRSVMLPVELSALQAWNAIMDDQPRWLQAAFRLRDGISARFGVRRIGGFTGARVDAVAVGDRLDFFLVERQAPDLLVLTERDRHLDVMTSITAHGRTVTIMSSVVTHNWFGRLYMLPVGPVHRFLVESMFRRLERRFTR